MSEYRTELTFPQALAEAFRRKSIRAVNWHIHTKLHLHDNILCMSHKDEKNVPLVGACFDINLARGLTWEVVST